MTVDRWRAGNCYAWFTWPVLVDRGRLLEGVGEDGGVGSSRCARTQSARWFSVRLNSGIVEG